MGKKKKPIKRFELSLERGRERMNIAREVESVIHRMTDANKWTDTDFQTSIIILLGYLTGAVLNLAETIEQKEVKA